MKGLPAPSDEQRVALGVWLNGDNQVCSAAAGSGKSTLLLHACAASPEPVVIVTYNKQLQLDMSQRLENTPMLDTQHACYTFHGLCSAFYANTPDDDTMHDVLDAVEAGGLPPNEPLRATRICIDEAQDMKPVFHRLLRNLVEVGSVQWLLVGDEVQMLNDFDPDDPASLDFMKRPWDFFGGGPASWVRSQLSVSFRLSEPAATFVNAVREDSGCLKAGRLGPGCNLPVRLHTCSDFSWYDYVMPWIRATRGVDPTLTVALLVERKKNNLPLRLLVNKLALSGVPVHLHGHDDKDPAASRGKVVVSTWHSSKGTEADLCAVLGVNSHSQHNPLHVALTRGKLHMLVIQSLKRPSPSLLSARSIPPELMVFDRHSAAAWDAWSGKVPPAGGPRTVLDLNDFSPRGRCLQLRDLIVTDEVSPCSRPRGREHSAPSCADRHYRKAAEMMCEYRETGRCRRLSFMLAPQCLGTAEDIARSGRNDYTVGATKSAHTGAALPRLALEQLHLLGGCPKSCADWLTVAVCSDLWSSFHHNVDALLPTSRWADDELLMSAAALVQRFCQESELQEYDQVHSADRDGVLLWSRCFAASSSATCSVIYEDEPSRASRVRACVPLALHPTAEFAFLVNPCTGEVTRLSLESKGAFLDALLRASGCK